jgi:Carboxypeptidase regulatory-like domain
MTIFRYSSTHLSKSLFMAAVVALWLASAAFSQVLTGTITGIVTDPTDAVVPGATVAAKDLDTGKEYKTTTDAKGEFTLTNLPNSNYSVTVDHPGFARAQVARLEVGVSQVAKVPVKLEVAKTGTEVVVESQAATVQTESAELKNTVTRSQLDSMPLPTRNPIDLVKSFAGILTPNVSGVTGGDAFVNGLRGNTTNLTQDGINVQDNFVKTSAFFALSAPVADSIGEMNVTVGGVGADAGFGSAQVSMRTQRGGNDPHGSVYWYQRNNDLNANTWFNNAQGTARPFQHQNRLGATVGGPVWLPKVYHGKNKTFFFFAYEAYREPRAQPRTRTVMTTGAEQGLFTYTPTTGGGPLTVNLLNVGTIGSSATKPAIDQAIMGIYTKYVPQSGYTDSGCGSGDGVNIRCISLNLAGVNNTDRYTVRIDHQLTQKHSIEFVFNESKFNTAPDFLNSNEPQFPGSPFSGGQISTRQVAVWALESVINEHQTNEFRVGFQRAPVAFAYDNTFGETGGNQVAYSLVTSPIETTTNLPQGRNTPERQFIDNYAWVKGTHQFRFGGEYRWLVADSYFWNTVFPRVSLGTNSANSNNLSSSTLPGVSAAELTIANAIFNNITGMLGSISQGFNHTSATSGYVAGKPEEYTPVQQNLAFYLQDAWKVKRNLTIQYGTRWEYQGPYDARNGLVLLPQSGVSSLFGPTNVGQYYAPGLTNGASDVLLTLQGGSNGHPTVNRDMNNFAPFLGVAYAPGNQKTSIRANFSTHYVQDGFTFWTPATTSNTGLFSTFSNSVPTGVFANSGLPLPAPTTTGGFPVSQVANWIASGGTASMTAFDPNLRTPYVLEWSLGVQRELPKHYTFEARYVGNHALKQYRSYNINELNIGTNGLLQEFVNAQNNYNINVANKVSGTFANNGLAGQVPTPLLDKMFTGVAAASAYSSSTFITNLTQNNIYSMFNTIRTSPTYRNNVLGTNVNNPTLFPLNFFVANPWAAAANLVSNAGWSYYDALEVEVQHRMSGGLFMLANYTFSKVMADTTFGESQSEGQSYLSLYNTRLDKFRSGIDVRQSFGLTMSYPLPVGRGRHFGTSMPRAADVILGGWTFNGFTHWSTGGPFSITSRTTMGDGLTQTANIANMTAAQLQSDIGTFRTGAGVYWLNPNSGLFTVKGSTSTVNFCTAGQTTPCFAVPGPGQMGNTAFNNFTLPRFFDQDLSFTKQVQLWERVKFEARLEAFDVFNNPNFAAPSNSLDSTTFGQLTSTFDTARGGGVTSRIVQFGFRLLF